MEIKTEIKKEEAKSIQERLLDADKKIRLAKEEKLKVIEYSCNVFKDLLKELGLDNDVYYIIEERSKIKGRLVVNIEKDSLEFYPYKKDGTLSNKKSTYYHSKNISTAWYTYPYEEYLIKCFEPA